MEGLGYRKAWAILMSARMHGIPASGTVTYNRDSRDPSVGWHLECVTQ
jgi:hypothetical protein